ncbi:MAG: PmoA family protein [Planctomycetia bacterium]|nr:PmoA family protein [Planctomycetia bacterium]
MIRFCALLTALASMLGSLHKAAADVSVEQTPRGVTVKVDGQPFTEYLIKSGSKPILWPIFGPTGKRVTRNWPMEDGVASEKDRDHIHQRSLWFTHGSVNGIDFWSEGKGRIEHREFGKVAGGPQAVIVTHNDWLSPDGSKLQCQDERTLTFGADADRRWIDFEIAIKATGGPVTFGDTKEGSFGMRVASTLRVDSQQGGKIINSDGQTDGAAWGKPAAWVDYHGPVEGETVGIAILNHPSSFRFPTYWHVRGYGLFAANPFGLHDFTGTMKGEYTLPAGETLKFRYRVLLHKGDEKAGRIADAFAEFSK